LSNPEYIIGIDLGTTHCVLAYTEAHRQETDEDAPIHVFRVPQVVNPGEVKAQPMLPSFLFLPGPHDVPPGSMALPWAPDAEYVSGEFARKRGSEIPNRLVSSAKSWLSYSGVDRTEPILPLDAPADAEKVSPVEASARYLKHLCDAWNAEIAADVPSARFEDQDIYLTVPASFDAVARELTVKAAHSAGLSSITLLEEPQAAFYAWIEANLDRWRKAVHVGESILVCDVGGGTTDLSLIRVTEEDGGLALRRAAVGDHILLGGDNMDLTLAYAVQAKLAAKGTRLDAWQFRCLWHNCRVAKELLLGNPDHQSEPVVILGRGSSLIGGTIRTELSQDEVRSVLLDGFFPEVESSEYPKEKPRVGMREMGLPYETDPAVTRHLARFLGRQAQSDFANSEADVEYPGAVLFNGGVMKSELIRHRLLSVLDRWSGGRGLRELASPDLDLAVARGAAYYGLARKGRGIRIRGGIGRPYYIGVESAMPAVPGIPAPMKALCVVPFGMEEGTEADIREKEFGLVVGEPAVFHLFASTVRKKDLIGEIVEDWAGEIEEVTTMEMSLPSAPGEEGGKVIPVWLQSKVTEVGALELWCVSRDEDHRWKLEFNLRERTQE
jgi:molecular chaperone DnaK (HSP70)